MRRLPLVVTLLAATTAHADKSKPVVRFEPPDVKGALDAKAVKTTFKRSASKYLACYKPELAAAKREPGTVHDYFRGLQVRFAIEASGKVSGASIVGGKGTAFESCLITAVSKLKFAKPKDKQPVDVTYGIVFYDELAGGWVGHAWVSDEPMLGSDHDTGELPGGAGASWGTIGTGTLGKGGGGGSTGAGTGVSFGKLKGPVVVQGLLVADGDLDKEIIRRFVRRNMAKVRYCYERELVANPKLTGKLVADFVIAPDGTVSSSTASGLHPNVDACIANVFKSIEFPKPKNNSSVAVEYPLSFRPAD